MAWLWARILDSGTNVHARERACVRKIAYLVCRAS